MSRDFQSQFDYSRRFIPHIRKILGECLIEEATPYEDMKEASDLVVLRAGTARIAVRVRKPNYRNWYIYQFTIRAKCANGSKTEYDKILEGFGDYLFYGFGNENASAVQTWGLGDLKVFRAAVRSGRCEPCDAKLNFDGATAFLAYNWHELPPGFILSCSSDLAAVLKSVPGVSTDLLNRRRALRAFVDVPETKGTLFDVA